MRIDDQPDTETYPQETNKIRGKRLGLGFYQGTKPEELKPRNQIELESNPDK